MSRGNQEKDRFAFSRKKSVYVYSSLKTKWWTDMSMHTV